MSQWFWKTLHYFFGLMALAVLFGLIIFAANVEIKDLDLWLHLGVGRYIVETQSIPSSDILSATIAGRPWINHEWLFQVILYMIYQQGGVDGLIAFQVGMVVITFILLLFFGYSREKLGFINLFLLLIFFVYQTRFTLRPDMFSLLFLAMDIYLLGLYLANRATLWIMFVIQVIWSNIHGFFIFGPLLALLAICVEYLKRHFRLPWQWHKIGALSDSEFKRLKQIALALILACLVNPYGVQGVFYPFQVLFSLSNESKVFFEHISELQQPIVLSNVFSFDSYPAFRILFLLSFLSFLFNFRRIDIGVFVSWLIFLIFSLAALRNLTFFAFIAYFTFLVNAQYIPFSDFFSKMAQKIFRNGSSRRFFNLLKKNVHWPSLGGIILNVFLISLMLDSLTQMPLRGYFDFERYERKSEFGGISQRNFPIKAVDFLAENHIGGNFFNDFNSGAYLVGRCSPKIKVFIDGRTEVYGAQFFKEYQKIWSGDKKLFEEYAARFQLTGAFLNSVYVPAPAGILRYLYEHKDWALVYFDYDAAIFLKRIPANDAWIRQFSVDLSQWEVPHLDLIKIGIREVVPYQHLNRAKALFNLRILDKAEGELKEALQALPHYTEAYLVLGKVYLEQKKFLDAFEQLRKAKILDPAYMEVRYHLAMSFYYLGEFKKAKGQCERLLEHSPSDFKAVFLLAFIYAEEKNYDQSWQMLQRAHTLAPQEVNEIIKLGDVWIRKKEYSLALKVFSLAQEIDAKNEIIQKKIDEIGLLPQEEK